MQRSKYHDIVQIKGETKERSERKGDSHIFEKGMLGIE